ncbi:MAG: hypothetical protein KJ061_18225 [Vicinamibacteraceae bacterium]|nr:hypothetical protein [Vicinamibacteraceae bacterium]
MTFARRVFLVAGLYGLVVLLPQYFFEGRIAERTPPAITHPEYFYGFIGVALAWQIVFLLIARDPVRYRVMMVPSVLEKASFGFAAVALCVQGRLNGEMLAAGLIDLVLGTLFVVSYLRTSTPPIAPAPQKP